MNKIRKINNQKINNQNNTLNAGDIIKSGVSPPPQNAVEKKTKKTKQPNKPTNKEGIIHDLGFFKIPLTPCGTLFISDIHQLYHLFTPPHKINKSADLL